MYIVVIYNFINIVQDGYIYYKQGCLFIVGYFSEFFCDLLYDYKDLVLLIFFCKNFNNKEYQFLCEYYFVLEFK